jgi:hypothetical protein
LPALEPAEDLGQPLPGAMEVHSRRDLGAGKDLSYLGDRPIFEIEEDYGGALGRWELRHRSQHVDVDGPERSGPVELVLAAPPQPFAPDRPYRHPDRDSPDPGIGPLVLRDAPPAREELDERLLGDVPRLLPIVDDQVHRVNERRVLRPEQTDEVSVCTRIRLHGPCLRGISMKPISTSPGGREEKSGGWERHTDFSPCPRQESDLRLAV